MRVGYLGPAGTFSEQALLASPLAADAEPVPLGSIHDTVMAVHDGAVDRALVPIENALEGAVRPTLDALAGDARDVVIVGETVLPIRTCLIARAGVEVADVAVVLSHPQPLAQCAGFLRRVLPQAAVRAANSTAEAVRAVAESTEPWAALGPRAAADHYGCPVLREGVDDDPDNATRFVWLAPAGTPPAAADGGAFKTSLVFSGAGDASPGWLVRCLSEFAFRGVNLTRIESRPLRGRLGHYVFHVDCDGASDSAPVAGAIEALRAHCDQIRLLGSYPVG
ncbi:MAG: prephenate dehydratase [Solirubrobacteraceae bacterium]